MTLWLLGGHDPTHGAGIYRDLVTARRLAPDLPRRFVVTALTEQGRGAPATAFPVGPERLIGRVQCWPSPAAIKVGLCPVGLAPAIANLVAGRGCPVVVDPVLAASDGGALGATVEGVAPLLDVATVITPNRPEAERLLAGTRAGGEATVRALAQRWPRAAIVLKGGHDPDPKRVCDWLAHDGRVRAIERPRHHGPDPRGTGCALATAVAVRLAQGETMDAAVDGAIAWLDVHRRECVVGSDGRPHLRE